MNTTRTDRVCSMARSLSVARSSWPESATTPFSRIDFRAQVPDWAGIGENAVVILSALSSSCSAQR